MRPHRTTRIITRTRGCGAAALRKRARGAQFRCRYRPPPPTTVWTLHYTHGQPPLKVPKAMEGLKYTNFVFGGIGLYMWTLFFPWLDPAPLLHSQTYTHRTVYKGCHCITAGHTLGSGSFATVIYAKKINKEYCAHTLSFSLSHTRTHVHTCTRSPLHTHTHTHARCSGSYHRGGGSTRWDLAEAPCRQQHNTAQHTSIVSTPSLPL